MPTKSLKRGNTPSRPLSPNAYSSLAQHSTTLSRASPLRFNQSDEDKLSPPRCASLDRPSSQQTMVLFSCGNWSPSRYYNYLGFWDMEMRPVACRGPVEP